MEIIHLNEQLKSKYGSHKSRTRHRYSVSDVYFILQGMSPDEWMYGKEKEIVDLVRMYQGIMVHDYVLKLFDKDCIEQKKECSFGNITLVGVADYLPKIEKYQDQVWELKTNEQILQEPKEYQLHQTKMYTTLFGRKEGVIYQPIQGNSGVFLNPLAKVERDDVWFMEQIGRLFAFDLRCEDLWKKEFKF
jgi:hypothetical protein